MKTKLIPTPGRGKVLCRALKDTEHLKKGDVSYRPEAEYCSDVGCAWYGSPVELYNDGISRAYRPLPKKPRKVKGESVKVWAHASFWSKPDGRGRKWMTVFSHKKLGKDYIEIEIRRKK